MGECQEIFALEGFSTSSTSPFFPEFQGACCLMTEVKKNLVTQSLFKSLPMQARW